ncbi:TPA: hypothetical protein ACQZDU_002907, partial [Escherichia coli]
ESDTNRSPSMLLTDLLHGNTQEALPGCRSISDDDLCAWCTRLLYRPGEISLCRLSTGNGIWPSVCDRNGYAYGCPEFQPNIIHP